MREGKPFRAVERRFEVYGSNRGNYWGCGEVDSKGIPEKFAEVNCKM